MPVRKRESVYEFSERYEDLNRVFNEVLYLGHYETQYDAMSVAVERPARRFYVSEQRLAEVINQIESGREERLPNRKSPKYEMFMELYRRYRELAARKPHLSKMELCTEVIYQPAPKFYMNPSWGIKILYEGRRRRRHHHRRRDAQ